MTSSDKGTLHKRKDGKYLVYLPLVFTADSNFPCKLEPGTGVNVKVWFRVGEKIVTIEETTQK